MGQAQHLEGLLRLALAGYWAMDANLSVSLVPSNPSDCYGYRARAQVVPLAAFTLAAMTPRNISGSVGDAGGSMTTTELIAKLKNDDPDGEREVVIWDRDEEVIKGVRQVELSDDRVVVEVTVELRHHAPA
jgi:hypothetical protein